MTDKRLIEVTLPLAAISAQSAREKSIRHGHISTLHIWWARRPLAAMRAAIFASLIPDPGNDEERKKLEDLIAIIVDWDQVKSGNSAKVEEAKALIRQVFPERPPRLLDPFMGGGATGLEALRLGCETHAVELNPVAHLIELCTLVYPQQYGQPEKRLVQQGAVEVEQTVNPLAEDVRKWGQWVLERAREEIGHLYANPAGPETIVGYLWARTVTCPNPACRAEMPLVRQWWLANSRNRRIAMQPIVDREEKRIAFEINSLGPQQNWVDGFDPSKGTTSQGHATCLVCGQVADVENVRDQGVSYGMGEMPLAIIYDQEGLGKAYRPFSSADWDLYQQAMALLATQKDLIPTEPLPPIGTLGFRVQRYGLTQWGDIYNQRQLLSMITLSRQVRNAYDTMVANGSEPDYAKAVATYLALAVDSIADRNCTQCVWRGGSEDIGHAFGRQALSMIWDYAETNPGSGSTGSWGSAIDKITRVIEHGSLVATHVAILHQGTATRLPYPDQYFDAVITDPPYYDAVPYADLSDFFYVWLKRSNGFLHPDIFRTPLTPKSAEIIQEPVRHAGDEAAKAFYEREMTQAFAEARRVLHIDGIFAVVFAHKSTTAWETLLNSLLDAGLVVTASWPLHTEMSGRLRAMDSAALASSIFIVCRVRAAEADGYLDDVRQELAATIRERLDYFWQQGIRGADFFISAIGPAVAVFGRYSRVYNLDGSQVTVGELLDLVQALVSEYALDRILNGGAARVGGVDAPTRYYILHRWAYGGEKIPFDDAMRLAMALGADVSALMERRGILKQSGETVSLRGPRERGKQEDLGLPDRTGQQAAVIDVVQAAASLWERGDRAGLARFLAEAAFGREDQVRLVAQTLVNVLPDDDAERRLLEGFLAGRELLAEQPRQERLL